MGDFLKCDSCGVELSLEEASEYGYGCPYCQVGTMSEFYDRGGESLVVGDRCLICGGVVAPEDFNFYGGRCPTCDDIWFNYIKSLKCSNKLDVEELKEMLKDRICGHEDMMFVSLLICDLLPHDNFDVFTELMDFSSEYIKEIECNFLRWME